MTGIKEGRPMAPGPCVFAVYESVLARMTAGRDEPLERKQLEANIDALAGPLGIAARLAQRDVEFGRPARPRDELCCAVCVEPCELHPHHGATVTTKKS